MHSDKRLLRWMLAVVALATLPIIFDLTIDLWLHGTVDWLAILRHTDILIVILVVSIESVLDLIGRTLKPRWIRIGLISSFFCLIISLMATLVFAFIKFSGAAIITSMDLAHTNVVPTPTNLSAAPVMTPTPFPGAGVHTEVASATPDTQTIAILMMVSFALIASFTCKLTVERGTESN
jgi:hypothetical protein